MTQSKAEREALLLAGGWQKMGDYFYKDELTIMNASKMEAKIRGIKNENQS